MNSNTIFSIIQNASVIIASLVAIYGITAWRREARWKRKYELAEEVLSLFYECKEKIAIIRSPFGYTTEGKTRKRNENETREVSERLDSAYIFIERYEREKEPFIKLRTLKFRFMTIFGKDSGKYFDEITKILNTIFLAANRLATTHWVNQGRNQRSDTDIKKHSEEMQKNEKIIWSDPDQSDETTERIETCIKEIENYCKSVMHKQLL
jgi:hypothetical protein